MKRQNFKLNDWQDEINVYDFIVSNYTPYYGDESFLVGPTEKTKKVWKQCLELLEKEREKNGLLNVDLTTFSGINNFKPGYIDKENEAIVGL